MLTTFVGLLVMLGGFWGMYTWRIELMLVLKGLLPLCFFFGGMVTLIVGLSTIKSGEHEVKLPTEPDPKSS